MMYPRLKLARNLLTEDGTIWISIDESEHDNVVKLCSEIFGEGNHLATFTWKTRQASGKQVAASNISIEHEHIVVFGRSQDPALFGVERNRDSYANPDNDPRGPWAKHPLDVGSTKQERPNCFYDLVDPISGKVYPANPNRVWAFAPESMNRLQSEGKILFHPEGKTRPYLKKFFAELKNEFKPISTWLDRATHNIGFNTEGTKEANDLFGGDKVFDYPKPVSLIRLLVRQATSPGDIVLDFFAGSGTTGHAIFAENSSEVVQRSFILVQLPQEIIEGTGAAEAGYNNIAELARERIRRAATKVRTQLKSTKENFDAGFRAFRTDAGNFQSVGTTPSEASQSSLAGMISHIKEDRSDEDLLFGALLRWGVDITLPVEKCELAGRTAWVVDPPVESQEGAAVVACFARPQNGKGGIDTELAGAIAALKPLRVLFRDDGFATDAIRENVASRFKQLSPDTTLRVL